MKGAIIGDIVGSYYEVKEIQAKRFSLEKKCPYEERIMILHPETPLLSENCSYTDDSVLTTAIADCILKQGDYEFFLREYGQREISLGLDKYGRSRFGSQFVKWLQQETEGTSFGNGSAMRVSPIGFYFSDMKTIEEQATLATIPSHNHPDAILAAKAVASAIFLARNHVAKKEIYDFIVKNYYDLSYSLESLQRNYIFSSQAKNSVPQALFCFLISKNFEDAIRTSISIGGDSDTIACICGALAEAYYGIDETIWENAQPFIPDYMKQVTDDFYQSQKGYSYIKK